MFWWWTRRAAMSRVAQSGATAATFARDAGDRAVAENPGKRILIKTHPETQTGPAPRPFHDAESCRRKSRWNPARSRPGVCLEGAVAVYTVSSLSWGSRRSSPATARMVFGQPFYAGWGLTQDRTPPPRRGRNLTRVQMFAAAMILAPLWYDPCLDRLCSFEEALNQLEAETRAWREDRLGHVASGMRLWKRSRLRAFFGQNRLRFFRLG